MTGDCHPMPIKAVAPWFGGKRTLAPRIVAELGPHLQYFEPFCGSMAVLLAKPPSTKETVNDRHGDLINLARVIAEAGPAEELYDRLQRVVMTEAILEEARTHLAAPAEASEVIGTPQIGRAYWYFLASWMGRNGTAGTARVDYQIAVRWTKNGGSPTKRFQHAAACIPAWHRRLRNVVIICRDAFQFLHRFEDVAETAVYVDPPYLSETRTSLEHGAAGGRYLHEFAHEGAGLFAGKDDHARLAQILRAYRHARIVVSSYDCPRVRELYAGWTVIDCAMNKQLHAQGGRGYRKLIAPEILLINGESYSQGQSDEATKRRSDEGQ